MTDGGIRIPSVPPAAIAPEASRVSYPALSIGRSAMTPMRTTTAPTIPDAMPQKAQTRSVVTASEAGTRRNASWTLWNMRSTSAARSITYPMNTNSGTESSVSLVMTPYVRCTIRSKTWFCHQCWPGA
jgi:hypothetical protein